MIFTVCNIAVLIKDGTLVEVCALLTLLLGVDMNVPEICSREVGRLTS